MSVIYEADAGDRVRTDERVDVIAGQGMVTPVRPFVVDGEQLIPGIDRFSPEHEWVRKRCELFEPCMATDAKTRERMRSMYQRAEEELVAAPTRTSTGPLRLP